MERISTTDIQTIKQWLGTGSINIFGLPFSGKDTHGHELAALFDTTVLSGGDILRNSVVTPELKEAIDAGKLAPTDEYIQIVLPYLSREDFRGRPLLLSSVGRWHGEEDGVVGACIASGHPLKAVIYLRLDEATSHARFVKSQQEGGRGNRADDDERHLQTRYREFYDKTLPVITYYRQHGLLIEVDGIPPKAEVSETILEELLKRAKGTA